MSRRRSFGSRNRSGNLQHEFTGSNCVPLEGPGVRQELIGLLRYLRLCMFFSKKPYEVFLEFGRYGDSEILIRKSKARLMKPAFTVVRDESTRCFLLLIRGAISAKERLTAATAAEVPFHHSVLQEGRKSNTVVGHAHCGMVAAARWIADQAIPCLTKAVEQFPDYRVKIIGHSMGAGIAAILTYMLRENKKLSSSSCVAFGPAACMTWNLAESGKDFVTTFVNKNDLVPSFGKASAANLRTEVMASSWAPDLREQIQRTRILGFVNRSMSFMRSHDPLVSNPGSKVVDVNMQLSHTPMVPETLEPVVNPTQGIASLKSPYVGNHQNTGKSTAGESASCSPEELNHDRSDAEETDQEEKAGGQEHMDQLLEALRSSSTTSQATHQLYPPGRMMHMVVLPAPEELSTAEPEHQDEAISVYETPRSMYRKIRLAKSMIRDHYMPSYIETMEMLIDKLDASEGHNR